MKPIVIETFKAPDPHRIRDMTQDEPDVFNGEVSVVLYRITIEKIEEHKDAIYQRLIKLWRESGNIHHIEPLKAEAKRHGLDLPSGNWGKSRKRKQ